MTTAADNAVFTKLPRGALGPYGDVPVACAVFEVDIDKEAGVATDSRYTYASKEYALMTGRSTDGLVGLSYLDVGEVDADEWLGMCYRVVANGESINGFEYNNLVRDWISFRLAPSAAEGCCVYTFINITLDEEQRNQVLTSVDARTSRFVSELLTVLSGEQSYEAAMNGALEMMSKVIKTDRMGIFQCFGEHTKVTFERCAEGVPSQLGTVFPLPKWALDQWFRNLSSNHVMLVPDTVVITRFSPALYEWCKQSDVKSLMAAPFFNNGEIVGFLGAYNYQIDETIDLDRMFAAVSSFIAARIENRRLIESLEWAGEHDSLTSLLNRRGSDRTIHDLLVEQPENPCVFGIIDIDDFKHVNDKFGHNGGDEALKALARAMEQAFPENAILSRNGGDEFLVVLWGQAAENADKLIAAFSQRRVEFEFKGERYPITTSLGYALYPNQATTPRQLYSKADAALYEVKTAGKAGFAKAR